MSAEALEAGYWRAYREFYSWGSILAGAGTKEDLGGKLRHLAYAGGWKKLEPLWDLIIRTRRVANARPVLETVLAGLRPRSHADLRSHAQINARKHIKESESWV
jgi:hypothetical protein